MQANENFNFAISPFVSYVASGATNGTTTTPQLLGTDFTVFAHNGVSPSAWAEPEKIITEKNEHHIWDALSRMILITQRQSGTGTWTGKLQYARTGGPAVDVVAGLDFPLASANAAQVTVIDNPLPANFGKQGTPLLTDKISFSFTMTAIGQAVAANWSAVMLLVPGFLAAESNKGVILSANQFRTIV